MRRLAPSLLLLLGVAYAVNDPEFVARATPNSKTINTTKPHSSGGSSGGSTGKNSQGSKRGGGVVASPLVPNNATFATDVGSTTGVTDAWWRETDGNGTNTITWIAAPAELAGGGAHAMQLSSTNASTGGDAYLEYKWTKAEIDSSTGVLTFDASIPNQPSGRAALFVLAKDTGGTIINSTANGAHVIAMFGNTLSAMYGSAADLTTLYTASAATNTKYTKSFNLKTWVQAKLSAGKTWTDVATVTIAVNTYAQSGGYSPSVMTINNFR